MNKDQIEGTLKEQKGKLTDDLSEQAGGMAQKHKGDAKDAASDKLEDVDERLSRDDAS